MKLQNRDAVPPVSHTRQQVAAELGRFGPLTVADLAGRLHLTPAAIRRHLDRLRADRHVDEWSAAPTAERGRGRPAAAYVLTDAGHSALSSDYDDLALAALSYLQRVHGPAAVADFARERFAQLQQRYSEPVSQAGPKVADRVYALAESLSADGYAASVRASPDHARASMQLCQGHCPMAQVARQFPQLCEAETQMMSQLLGVHVQRLATLAHGDHVCTTVVPIAPASTSTIPTQLPDAVTAAQR